MCLKNKGEGGILCQAYAFLHKVILALKSFITFIYISLLSINIKKFQSFFKKFNQSMIIEKLSILEFAELSPS